MKTTIWKQSIKMWVVEPSHNLHIYGKTFVHKAQGSLWKMEQKKIIRDIEAEDLLEMRAAKSMKF